jgi:hypothetical protein
VSGTTYSLDASIGESSPGAHDGNGLIDAGPTGGVAVDPATGDVYTSHPLRNELQTLTFNSVTTEVDKFTIGNLPAACASSTTAEITYTSTGSTRRDRIDNALEAACTNASPLSGSATNGGDFKVSSAGSSPVITFQGQFASKNTPQLACTHTAGAGTCLITTTLNGGIGQISQYHSNGALVTEAIGSGLSGASYSGLDVYGTNGRIYAFDGAHSQIAIFNPGQATPASTFNGSATPGGSISAGGIFGEGIAVDQSNGHVFVYDSAHNVVDEFKASGEYVTQLSNSFLNGEPSGVAVDNSGTANDGDIYVVSLHAVDAFGALEHAHLPSLSHTGYTDGCGAAVDSHGDLYAADFGTVHVYDPNGAEITSLSSPQACQLAVDASGSLYVQEWIGPGGAGGKVRKYVPSQYPPVSGTTYSLDASIGESSPGAHDGNGLIDAGPTGGVAVDPATGDVYTSHPLRNELQTLTFNSVTTEVDKFTIGNLPAACASSTTAEITYTSTGSTRRDRIDNALEAACTNASPLSGSATNGGDFKVSSAGSSPVITFQGQFASKNTPQLACTHTAGAGTCLITTTLNGGIGQISQYHSNGALVTEAIGSGLSGASYSGLDVYGTNGRIYAFDGAHSQIAIFNPGQATPASTFNGSATPGGSISAGGIFGEGIAVDQSNGHVFVYDSAHNVVDEFKASGEYVTQLSNSFLNGEPSGVAVDNSGTANDGDIYVVSLHAVDAFGAMSTDDQLNLTALKDGTGFGAVSGGSSAEPSAIDCGSTCDAGFEPDTEVTLTATPNPGSLFVEWTGCDSTEGTEEEICKVTMNANKAVTATFKQRTLTVTKDGPGTATITSSPTGIDCGATCTASFPDASEVSLTPSAPLGSRLKSWSGCDSVIGEVCKVTMSADKAVNATIAAQPSISSTEVANVGSSTATLKAKVNPEGEATTYRFEYITEAAWLANGESFSGPQPASKAPASPVAIGSGTSPVAVGIKLTGLTPFTHYRFRVAATNETGTAEGERDSSDEEIPHAFTTFALPQVFSGECPANEALRSGPSAELPDCRAYEQASPVNKNGGGIQGKAPITRTSLAGDAISFESPAGIPGGEGAQEFPSYAGLRGPGSWSTRGLLPNALTGQSAKWLGWTPDFAEVFDEVFKFGVGIGLIAKSTHTGVEQTIVPYTNPFPKFAYVGSSEDRSTVIFEASDQTKTNLKLTPDAAPGKPNVYAWSHDAPATIRLAGVLPDGSTPAQGTGAGSNALVQEYVRDTHRLAPDGSVFFEDLETGKLYERLNPAAAETTDQDIDGNCEPDPLLACTVAISASQKENGGGIDGHDAAGSRPATFMAASEDGSSALFLSSEKLTDDATTGPEPALAAIARADKSNGANKDLGFIPAFAHEIAIDQATEYVYWTDPAHGRIGRSKLDKSDFTETYISGLGEPQGIAVIDQGASQYIFWTERGALDENGKAQAGLGSIGRADLNGGNVKDDCVTGITNPRSIAADASFIYWTMPGISPGEINSGLGKAGRAELSCGAVETDLTKGVPDTSGDIAVDASHIYVSADAPTGKESFIWQFNLDGSGPGFHGNFPINVTGVSGPASLALDGSHLYWTNPGTSEIGRSDLDGANQDFDFITGAGHPEDLALDGAHIYWTANQKVVPNKGTDLYRYDGADGKLHDLALDNGAPNGAEVQGVVGTSKDASVVYFVANGIPDGVGNSPNEEGESAAPGNCKEGGDFASGVCNLYVYHDGSVDFIARLDTKGNGDDGSSDAENWVRGRGELGKVESDKTARVSDDGRILVFRSIRPLTGYDNEGPICGRAAGNGERIPGPCTEFFRFTLPGEHLACITCDPRGEAPTGPAQIASIRPGGLGAVPGTAVLSRTLSPDGNRFFFETTDALVARDVNGEGGCPEWGGAAQKPSAFACQDVYEWEAPGTGSCEESSPAFSQTSGGCVYLISTGTSPEATFFADASLSGDNVFLYTYQQLVPQDQDALMDVYDARIDGGLTAQHQTAAVPCEGEACKEGASQAPAQSSPGTPSFQGPGNQSTQPKPRTRCPKGSRKVRRQGKARCVKRQHKRGRAAKTTGRAGR